MKSLGFRQVLGVTGRADLLRVLASAPRTHYTLDDDGEVWLGYCQQKEPETATLVGRGVLTIPQITGGSPESEYKLPLQMPFVHVIAERQTRELINQTDNPVLTDADYDPFTEDDDEAKAPEARRLVSYEDLVPKARLMPALKRYLSAHRTAGLDIPRLVKQIAGQQLPRHLPRRQIKTWHPQWIVVLDFCKRLWPYRQDMHQLAENLLHACGQSGVSIRIINYGPLQHWTDWVEEQRMGGKLPLKHAWQMPPAGTPVLLVTDLGLLEGPDSACHQSWQLFIKHLNQANTQSFALLPLGADQLDSGLPKALTLLRWSPDARIHPERAYAKCAPQPAGLEDLLAMAAVTRRVDPPLLRAMRRLNPKARLNAGLEGAFWCHPDVEGGSAANIRLEAQAKHLTHFAQLDDCHIQLEKMRYRHHAHLRAVLNHEETLLWGAHARLDDVADADESFQRLAKAEAFMHRLAATLNQPNGLQKGGIWWDVAQDIVQRADDVMGTRYTHLFSPLVAAIVEAHGDFKQVPDWIDPAELKGNIQGERVICWLVRDPLNGYVALQRIPENQNQITLGEPLIIDSGGIRIESPDKSQWYPVSQFANALCSLNEETSIRLITSTETLTLATVKRPRGAIAWGCDKTGFWLKTPAFCLKDWRWQISELTITRANNDEQGFRLGLRPFITLRREFIEFSNNSESLYGQIVQDDRNSSFVSFRLDNYGVLARLDITTEHDRSVMQTFRWIEPGSFCMGSPDDEPERFEDEGPQHKVTISRGFWLADTACTQAFWQAMMGSNPSHFNDNLNNPVEGVSWHDVQAFLKKLQALLPGSEVDLPSEAEWEYACRAGTDTPFSFGADINPEQVNYDGNYPYAEGKKGGYRKKTVPVKSLPANPWGLYEMHGNVWEWCKCAQWRYDNDAQVDPKGWVTGDNWAIVIRGGSWKSTAGKMRSAFRDALHPGLVSSDLGFRLCLRAIESYQALSGPSPDAVQQGSTSIENSLISKTASKSKPGSKPKRRS